MTHVTSDKNDVTHSTFSVERVYPASPARVFAAFANPQTKRRWFAEGEGWEVNEFTLDFRVGGYEFSRFRFKGGPPMSNDTIFLDIVPDQRIVFTFTMKVSDKIISISLATVEIDPADSGARLVYTEQGVFFEGAHKLKGRTAGTHHLFERLAAELQSQSP